MEAACLYLITGGDEMRNLLAGLILIIGVVVYAQPDGYYDDAEGKTGEDLQQALHDIIDNHSVVSYTYLWTAYRTTDKKANGFVWDMYGDVPGGTPEYDYVFGYESDGGDQCGNYSGEGSCYNREHSFPKSWFNDASPMYTDLFHVVPTDGYVNGKRSNYPFGETNSPSWTSTNGCKLGPSSVSGYTGTVFEPIDEYKGDFARIYFYMATRYYGEDGSWPGSGMVDGAQPKPWAREMLLKWHADDPVSDKEIARNDDVYAIQHNRNPYVDRPDFVNALYGGASADQIAPDVDSISVLSATELKVWFNEEIDKTTSEYVGRYYINGGASVISAELQGDQRSVLLEVAGLSNGSFNLTINGIEDLVGNAMDVKVFTIEVRGLAGVDILSVDHFQVYPNPNKGQFHVKSSQLDWHEAVIKVYDISGRRVAVDCSIVGDEIQISSDVTSGSYLLFIESLDRQQINIPLQIQ